MISYFSVSAKTSRCLANTSEIEVFTGPYFGGKISVEGSTSPLCAIYGDKESPKSVYTFVINYNLCGSKLIVSCTIFFLFSIIFNSFSRTNLASRRW